jgi:hypothetical protein
MRLGALFFILFFFANAAYAAGEMYIVMTSGSDVFFIDSEKMILYGPGRPVVTVYKASGASLEGETIMLGIDCPNKKVNEVSRHIYVFEDEEGTTSVDQNVQPSRQRTLEQNQINAVADFACNWPGSAKGLSKITGISADPKLRVLGLSIAAKDVIGK